MKALTYIEHGKLELIEKPRPDLPDPRDAIVTAVTLYDKAQSLPDMYGKNLTF